MKTVLNRALSLVMCLVLLCSTVSATAFGANAAEDFDYKTYAQNVTKDNVHYLFDLVDEKLAEANGKDNKLRMEVELLKDLSWLEMQAVELVLGLFVKSDAIKVGNNNVKILIDLSSVDAICKTVDNYRAVIALATNDRLNDLIDLGHLGAINIDVFDEGMSRAKSGDYKIFTEILELADANGAIIEAFLSGNLKLGVIESALPQDILNGMRSINVGDTVKGLIVDLLFEDKANYDTVKSDALKDFDQFVYRDVLGLVGLKGVDESTTIDHLITDVFTVLVNDHLIGLVEDKSFSFDKVGYGQLDSIIQIDGDYDFSNIKFTKDESVLNQINNVLGEVFKQIVPGFAWTEGSYDKIGDNMRNLVKYIAENSGADINTNVSDDVLMLEILKIIFEAGNEDIYKAVKDTKTLTEMVNKLVVHLSKKAYPETATYEQVIGDYIIEKIGSFIPLYDQDGKAITAGSGKTVWDVLNSVLNFFLVDKNLDSLFGWNFDKRTTFFQKLDIILDYTADDGSADFSSETYIKDLIDSIFRVDLQKFVNLTAVKALGKGRNEVSVVKFLYTTVYNVLNNWTARGGIVKQTTDYFDNTLSDESIANIAKVLIKTLKSRSEGSASFVGLISHFLTDISEKVEAKDATCTTAGFKTTKTCLKCKRAYMQGAKINAKGHKYNSGVITKAPKCTLNGEKTFTCTVCGAKRVDVVAKTGHKETGYKVTKAATYKTTGQKVNTCTVCKTTLGTQIINIIPLKKATGLKSQALSTTSVKFSWNAVAGAEAYNLYYKTGSGKWKKVDAKKKTSVTVKKLKAGTTYKFKVEAVTGGNRSESGTVNATTKPVAVNLSRVSSKKKKEVIVEWKKVAGVTGYEVQYSTAKNFKKGTKTVTIKKQKTVKTIIKKLKSKKKYYVRVCAYKTVNGVKVKGAYSKVKNIKCK